MGHEKLADARSLDTRTQRTAVVLLCAAIIAGIIAAFSLLRSLLRPLDVGGPAVERPHRQHRGVLIAELDPRVDHPGVASPLGHGADGVLLLLLFAELPIVDEPPAPGERRAAQGLDEPAVDGASLRDAPQKSRGR